MVEIIKDFAPASLPNIPNHVMDPEWITVHNTGNASRGANAETHNRYIKNGAGGRMASWHFTVDEDRIYQHIPTNRSAWHCTDGANGTGNRKSIGVEICMHSDQKDYKKAEANAIWLINQLRNHPEKFEHGRKIAIANIVPHFRWFNKNCPQLILPRWDAFIKEIDAAAKPVNLIQPVVTPKGVHIVARGETLGRIAALYKTTVEEFAKLNGITNANQITVGQRLDIPKPKAAPAPVPVKPVVPATYTVKAGDSLSGICTYYGVALADVIKWNNLKDASLILVGQVLHLTGPAPKPAPAPAPKPTPAPAPKPAPKPSYPLPTGHFWQGRAGMSATGIRQIQTALNALKFRCTVDGKYGPGTADAMRRFQSLRPSRLIVDGRYGPKTKAEMERELKKL